MGRIWGVSLASRPPVSTGAHAPGTVSICAHGAGDTLNLRGGGACPLRLWLGGWAGIPMQSFRRHAKRGPSWRRNWRSDQARIDSSVMKKNSFTLWNSGSTQLWPLRKSKASNGRASIGLLLGVFSSNLDDWRVSPSASAPANLRREYQKHVDPGCASEAWLCHQMDPR